MSTQHERTPLESRLLSGNRMIAARARFEADRALDVPAPADRLLEARDELWTVSAWIEAGRDGRVLEMFAALRREVAHLYRLLTRAARQLRALLLALAVVAPATPRATTRATEPESPPDSPPLLPMLAALIIAPGAPSAPRHSLAARAA